MAQNQDAYSASGFAHQRWHIHPLIPRIAGLIVVAAVGGVVLVSEGGQSQAPTATAHAEGALEGDRVWLAAPPQRTNWWRGPSAQQCLTAWDRSAARECGRPGTGSGLEVWRLHNPTSGRSPQPWLGNRSRAFAP